MNIIIAIPAYNEEKIIEANTLKVVDFCRANLKIDWQVVIADNKSTDQTPVIAKKLAQQNNKVDYLYVDIQGKGAAIRRAWQNYQADIYCFMDADLATNLSALPAIISEMLAGNDIVVGSRFHPKSSYQRSAFRKIFSFGYRAVLKLFLKSRLNDAPCGFKAINQKVKENVLPLVKNNGWFFDLELVILGEKIGYKIKEIPVLWSEPRKAGKSKVKVISVSLDYLKKTWELKKGLNAKRHV